MRMLTSAVLLFALLTALTGIVYPLCITGIAQALFPHQANGSLIVDADKIVGSKLIGQAFESDRYFWGRPSATAPAVYNATAGAGSNFGPTNPALRDAAAQRVKQFLSANPGNATGVPIDLVTASASGLDPHISPAGAYYQVARVARARGIEQKLLIALLERHIESRQWGFFGEPRVNVLKLNRALDEHVKPSAKL